QGDDNRNPESLVRYFLKEFTKKGDKVFDPFAGFGTTLLVSEELGRIPFGIEFSNQRADYIKSQMKNKDNLIKGSSLKIKSYKLPKFDFCFTSPPYMLKEDKENPFSAYIKKGNYSQYLKDLSKIFYQVKKVIKKDSYLVIEVSNLKGNGVTTLAWDIEREISKSFKFKGELVIGWKGKDTYSPKGNYGYGYDHSYCLIFKNNS
ncbi:MAG: DNA methyltransferase, partial [Patescibacteria group bacterium]